MKATPGLHDTITRLVREDRGKLLAALIAGLNSFELAEEALSDALESAIIHWSRSGLPGNPHGWLLKVARRKAIDRIRHNKRFLDRRGELERLAIEDEREANEASPEIPDKRLALIFTCCHPALDSKSRVALTLRTVGGLSTTEISRAFLDKDTTMGQRLSRARAKISVSGIPFSVPGPELWNERLASVLSVIYLIFNEGYSASSGELSVRTDLCEEAIFLARLLDQLRPSEPEVLGLLSLMSTTQARTPARKGPITTPLAEQDRGLWDKGLIKDGVEYLAHAMDAGAPGPYQIKAAISAIHVQAKNWQQTDWAQIILLYDGLLRFEPSPVVQLNRAVAQAESGDLDGALACLETLEAPLQSYQPFYAATAKYFTLAERNDLAIDAYYRAIELTGNEADRGYLIAEMKKIDR